MADHASPAVLIVDDDPVFCESLRLVLSADWTLFEAPDIKTALALIDKDPVDLAIVDMHLLDGSGADFIRVAGGLPCLLCTQDHGEPTFQSIFSDPSVAENVVGYLTKPLRAGAIWSIRAGLQIARERRLRNRLVAEATARLEEERRLIAADLHDTAGAALTQLSWVLRNIERAAQSAEPSSWAEVAAQCEVGQHTVRQAHADVARAVTRLRSDEVGVVGLRGAIEYMLSQWRLTAPSVVFGHRLSRQVDRIDSRRAGIIYRMVQEGVTNAMRHTDAVAVDVQMRCRDERMVLSIHSRGKVFRSEGPFLLSSLRERVASLGGALQFDCDAHAGESHLTVTIPV